MDVKTDRFRFFRDDLCDRCGDCFAACPYLELPREEARREIEGLIERGASRALDVCNTCHTCDVVCPNEADPYELVLERWRERRREGLPTTARLVTPSQPCNIWSSLKAVMPLEELALLRAWEDFGPCEEICLTGFYTNVVPYILQAEVLESLPKIVGSEALFGCAGDIYKTGRFDMVEQIMQRLEHVFAQMGVERVVCSMSAEGMVLSEILPRRFGACFDFEVVSLDEWLLQKLQSEEIELKKELDLKVTVHDNCLSKMQGGRLQEVNREIVRRTGCSIVEMEHHGERSMCCGFGAAAAKFRVMDIMSSGYRRLKEIEATGADAAVIYCPACLFILSVIKEMAGCTIPFYHPVELVELVAGGVPAHRHEERAWDIMAVISNHLLKYALFPSHRKSFQPAFIPPELERLPELPPADRLRMKALATLYHSPVVQNRVMRTIVSAGFKAAVAGYDLMRKRQLGLSA
ncbi:MAG: (Fe-S)-binding protein [Actinobacteria bacterium]|jgi:Fe-S oxidoreductase|nr:MAG: (Fe-S)-binding protein [Actinomycetota bacterium]